MKITTTGVANKGASAGAMEALTAQSSQEDFITALASAAAAFILENREAFDADNARAVQELVAAVAVDSVVTELLEILRRPPVPEKAENLPAEDAPVSSDGTVSGAAKEPKEGNPDMVSADVMALLDQ